MKLNDAKLRRQLEAIDKWKNSGGIGRIIQPTGFGKTYEMLLVADKFHSKNPNKKIIIVCNNTASKTNMFNSLHNFAHIMDSIIRANLFVVTRYEIINDTEKKYYKKYFSLLMVDEIHEFTSLKSYDILTKKIFDYNYILGLTGTDPTDPSDIRKLNNVAPIVDFISYEEAIQNKWIAKIKEFNIGLKLPTADQELNDEYSEYISESLRLVDRDYNLLRYMANGKYDKFTSTFTSYGDVCEQFANRKGWNNSLDLTKRFYRNMNDILSPSSLHDRAKKFEAYVRKRNRLHNSHIDKIKATNRLIQYLGDKTTMIFANDIAFIDVMTSVINHPINLDMFSDFNHLQYNIIKDDYIGNYKAVKFHSKIASLPMRNEDDTDFIRYKHGGIKSFGITAQRNQLMKRIENRTVQYILAVKGLDSAIDAEHVQCCIINGGTTNPLQQAQRKGRAMRITEYKNLSYIFNVYFIGTRDETKLRQRQLNSDVIEITNLNDIIL